MTTSISGLSSGLDTASIISQLMQLEAVQQTRLRSRANTTTMEATALRGINTKIAALATTSGKLTKTTAWSAFTATSSSDKATVTTTSSAQAGQVSFTVNALAAAHKLTYATTATLDSVVVGGGTTLTLDRLDGTAPVTIETTDGKLSSVVSAINNGGYGLRASALKLDDGTYRLSVESATTGAAGDFTLTNGDGSTLLGGATVRAGADAAITIGADTVHSSSNTFSELLPGLTVALSSSIAIGTTVDVGVSIDSTSAGKSLKALVDQVNGILGDIDNASQTKTDTTSAGPLAGDSTLRNARRMLTSTLYGGALGGLADLGVSVDRSGDLTFDQAAFDKAYKADPVAVTNRLAAGGFAERVQTAAKSLSDSGTGLVSTAIAGREATVKDLSSRIDAWDDRLAAKKAALTRQFAALETALNKMQSQSSWLAGQISSLPSSSG